MSRYPNPGRSPYRRGRRNEPVPLYVLAPSDPVGAVFAVVGALMRAGWRYRSELAPAGAAVALWWAGHRLHHSWPGVWPVLAVLVMAGAAGAVWAPRRWPRLRRLPWLERTTDRACLALWLAVGGGWSSAAVALGPSRPPLGALWLWGGLVCGVPWWVNRRRRAKVTVDRTIARWPEYTDTVLSLAGSRVISAARTAWGWSVRIALPRGKTVQAAINDLASIESALGARRGGVRIEPEPGDARNLVLRVIESDPHARPIGWPGLAAPAGRQASIGRPAEVGVFEDGTGVLVPLAWRHVLIGGATGAGKSGLLSVLLAVLTGCPDVLVWGVDMKAGMELRPWAACLHRLAVDPHSAVALLRDGVAELERRAALLAQHGGRLWQPTPHAPALVIVIDEYAQLPDAARESADSIARRGRAVAVTLLVATQRPTQAAMGHGAVRSQMDVRICLRVRERRDADLILGQGAHTAGWHPETLTLPGTFLISAPEHTHPRPARGYLLTDPDVTAIARRHAPLRPPGAGQPQPAARPVAPEGAQKPTAARTGSGQGDGPGGTARPVSAEHSGRPPDRSGRGQADLDARILALIRAAGPNGITAVEIGREISLSRSPVYRRLQTLALAGQIEQTGHGRWRATGTCPPGG